MRTRLEPHRIERARRLRRDATEVEKKLWRRLRELKPLGHHFRRQVPFRSYVLDFVEHRHRLVIELDGGQHGMPEGRLRDASRDRVLRDCGYRVLRFWNVEVTENIDGCVDSIVRALKERPPTRPPSPRAAAGDLPTRGR